MAVLQNTSFETAGVGSGTAASWSLVTTGTAAFEVGLLSPRAYGAEDFESDWSNNTYKKFLEVGDTVAFSLTTLLVDTDKLVEDFEELWAGNQDYLKELEGPIDGLTDSFDTGWGGTLYTSFDDVPSVLGQTERFETGWQNDVYLVGPDDVSFQTGFPGNANTPGNEVETFEAFYPARTFVAAPSNESITAFSHGLVGGEIVQVYNAGNGKLPTPLVPEADYYVTVDDGDTFFLSPDLLGVPIDITDKGLGTHYFYRDRRQFWDEVLTGV